MAFCSNAFLTAANQTLFDLDIGLGGSVVMELLKVVESPSAHTINFDNFFTFHALLTSLKSNSYFVTGTV